ncbi:uncharacterized protein LOC126783479 [Argentina anserina]|uniref:uncharacterized protein LOC126783479 n=1 Tax=Argentina anserina TaxID=57926 RepID=UPI0021762847|nr:uncharacterized protein LOC126783479 [Potentilla anserina]
MSWLAHSLSKSLRLDSDDVVRPHPNNNDEAPVPPSSTKPQQHNEIESDANEAFDAQTRGVKDDLSEFQQTLTRQFWGVASFLAPPPPPPPPPPPSHRLADPPDCDRSEPPDHRPGQSPIASNGYDDEAEEEEEYAVGVTEEVLNFARNIAMHPETWLDFPLDEEEDLGDFEMSDAQQEHTTMIEHLAPRLAALRIELCPCHMSESYFWKVYFVLLHSRLNKQDAEILSTPQVMEARAMWMQELQCQTPSSNSKVSEHEWFGRSSSQLKGSSNTLHEDYEDYSPVSSHTPHYEDTLHRTFPFESTWPSTAYETEKHPVESSDTLFIDKSVIEEKPSILTEDENATVGPSSQILLNTYDDNDDDDWPEDDDELYGCSGTAIALINEEDISFSDLEDDDFQAPSKLKFVPE